MSQRLVVAAALQKVIEASIEARFHLRVEPDQLLGNFLQLLELSCRIALAKFVVADDREPAFEGGNQRGERVGVHGRKGKQDWSLRNDWCLS